MATISYTVDKPNRNVPSQVVTWTTLTNVNADGEAAGPELGVPNYPIKSVQFIDNGGTTETVVLQGSNDGTNWITLNDSNGTAISTAASAIFSVDQVTKFVRPFVSAGSSVDYDVILLMTSHRGRN